MWSRISLLLAIRPTIRGAPQRVHSSHLVVKLWVCYGSSYPGPGMAMAAVSAEVSKRLYFIWAFSNKIGSRRLLLQKECDPFWVRQLAHFLEMGSTHPHSFSLPSWTNQGLVQYDKKGEPYHKQPEVSCNHLQLLYL